MHCGSSQDPVCFISTRLSAHTSDDSVCVSVCVCVCVLTVTTGESYNYKVQQPVITSMKVSGLWLLV